MTSMMSTNHGAGGEGRSSSVISGLVDAIRNTLHLMTLNTTKCNNAQRGKPTCPASEMLA